MREYLREAAFAMLGCASLAALCAALDITPRIEDALAFLIIGGVCVVLYAVGDR